MRPTDLRPLADGHRKATHEMRRSPLLPIFLTVFVDVLGLTLILPLLPYYAKDYGGTDVVAGALMAVYAACMFVSGPVLGRLSDRFGRKPILLISQLGTLAGWLILACSTSLEMLFVGRIIAGLTAGNLSIAQAYISDVTKPNEERTQAFGFFGIAFGTGFLLGPWISGLLTAFAKAHPDLMARHQIIEGVPEKLYKYQLPSLTAAALSLCAILLTIFILPARKPSASGATARRSFAFKQFLARPAARKRLTEFFLFSLSFSALTGGLSLYLQHRFGFDAEHAGYIFGVSGLIGALVQGGLLRRLARKYGEEKLAMIGLGAMAVGNGLLGFAFSLSFLLVLVVIGAFGAAVVRPSLTTLVTRTVSGPEQGSVLGVSQSLGSLAQIAGPLAASWLIGREHLGIYGAFCGGFSLLALFTLMQRPEPQAVLEAAPQAEQPAPMQQAPRASA